jgi:hypothetical protein
VNSDTCKKELDELLENEKLSEPDKEAILYRNAVEFYRL